MFGLNSDTSSDLSMGSYDKLVKSFVEKIKKEPKTSSNSRALGQLSKEMQDGLKKLSELDRDVQINPLYYQRHEHGVYNELATQANVNAHALKALSGIPESAKILYWKRLCGIRYFDIDNEMHVTKFILLLGEPKATQALNYKTVDKVLPELMKLIDDEIHHGMVRNSLLKLSSLMGSKIHKFAIETIKELMPGDVLLKKGIFVGRGDYFSDLVRTREGRALYEKYKHCFDDEAQMAYEGESSAFAHHRVDKTEVAEVIDSKKEIPPVKASAPVDVKATTLPQDEIQLMNESAAKIRDELGADGEVAVLYREYQDTTKDLDSKDVNAHGMHFVNYLNKVSEHQKHSKTTNAWIGCSEKVSLFCSQVAIVSDNKALAGFATGLSGITQAASSVREFSNGMKLLQAGGDLASTGMGIAGLFGGMGAFIGAVSLVSSLFEQKKGPSIDYAALTYALVNAMREEMRQGFQAMRESFDHTWKKLELMDEANQRNFNELTAFLTFRFNEVYRRFDKLSAKMQDRFDHIDWHFAKLNQQLRDEKVSNELARILRDGGQASMKASDSRVFAESFNHLMAALTPTISNAMSGSLTGDESKFTTQVKALHHPFFALTTLSSYLDSKVKSSSSLYSRSQMQRIINSFPKPSAKVILRDAIGLEMFLPKSDKRDLETLGKVLFDLAEDQIFIAAVEIAGSWVLFHASKGEQPTISLFGFSEASSQCRRLLIGILPNYFEIKEYTYPEEVEYHLAGIHCAKLVETVLHHPGVSIAELNSLPFDGSLIESYAASAQAPSTNEQAFSNPCVDLWLTLNIQRLITLYMDEGSDYTHVLDDENFAKLMRLIIRRNNQAALIVKASHPDLMKHLTEEYLTAQGEFNIAYDEWKATHETKLLENHRREMSETITQNLTSSGMDVTRAEKWWDSIVTNDDYSASWWSDRHYIIEDYLHRKGWRDNQLGWHHHGRLGVDSVYRINYKNDLKALIESKVKKNINIIDDEAKSFIKGIICISSLGHFECDVSTQTALRYIFPKDMDKTKPILIAPESFAYLLTPVLKKAYQLGLVQIRFSYEIVSTADKAIPSKFVIRGEWRSIAKFINGKESWHLFLERHYKYDPLFYQGNEAIWWYWEGGNIPVTITDVIEKPVPTYTGRTHSGALLRNHHVAYPKTVERIGSSISIDINTLSEQISVDERNRQEELILAIIEQWQRNVEIESAKALRREINEPESKLNKAASKMDHYYKLISAYLELIAFGTQEKDLYNNFFDFLAPSLYSSEAMCDHLSKLQSIKSFEASMLQAADLSTKIAALQKVRIHLPSLESPIQSASIALLNELRRRINNDKLGLINKRLRVINDEAKHLQNQIMIELDKIHDSQYTAALRSELQDIDTWRAELDGTMKGKHAVKMSQYQSYKQLYPELSEKLNGLQILIDKTQKLFKAGLIKAEALSKLNSLKDSLTKQHQLIGSQLEKLAYEFEGELTENLGLFIEINTSSSSPDTVPELSDLLSELDSLGKIFWEEGFGVSERKEDGLVLHRVQALEVQAREVISYFTSNPDSTVNVSQWRKSLDKYKEKIATNRENQRQSYGASTPFADTARGDEHTESAAGLSS